MSVRNDNFIWQHRVTVPHQVTASKFKMGDKGGDENKLHKQKSSLWKHFRIASASDRSATCNLCFKVLSYKSSITNLKKHFDRKHADQGDMIVKLSDEEEGSIEELETYLEDEAVEVEEEPLIDKRKILRNEAWEYFQIHDEAEKLAVCTLCKEQFSYRTTSTNLAKHLKRKHYAEIENNEFLDNFEEENAKSTPEKRKSSHKTSIAWEYFTVKDATRRIATCKLCDSSCSYMTSVSNLMKHVKRKHGVGCDDDDEYGSENEATNTPEKRKSSHKTSIAWEYFTVKDATRRIATCKLCDSSCSYMTSVSNLMKHVKRKHGVGCDDDDEYGSENEVTKQESNSRRSPLWLYFKCIDDVAKISVCLICKRQLSHLTSTSNLKRHLSRKHPGVKLKEITEGKKMLIASDGQLYEIDEAPKAETLDVDDDDQEEPMELNAIYLDDYEGSIIETKRKRKSSSSNRKHLLLSENNDSSDEEITYRKRYVKKEADSLDQFGKYLVSLLRQLPKELSNQIQADFVKQVMTAQLSYESQKTVVTPSNGYAITITETRASETNNDVHTEQYTADGVESMVS